MNMRGSEDNSDQIINDWINEYTRNLMWKCFKDYNCSQTSDEFLRGVLTKAQLNSCCSLDILLTQWMFLVYTGCDLHGNGMDNVTPLEEAINLLPRLRKSLSFNKRVLSKVERLLKEQAVLVCIKEREFGLARKVKERTWHGNRNEGEKEMSNCLDSMIQKRSLSGFELPSSFDDLMESAVNLLRDLCENHLPKPFLVKMAVKEGMTKPNDRSRDDQEKNKMMLRQTGIMLTGSLLSAFISKYGLVPEVGVGFISNDKFQTAVEALQSHKDKLLENIPECLATPVAAASMQISSSPAVGKEPPASRIKSYERRSRKKLFQTTSSNSLTETESDSNDLNDSFASKKLQMSLRKRIACSSETLFHEVKPLQPRKKLIIPRKPRIRWNAEEEKILYQAVQKYGFCNWAEIVEAELLPGRSNVDVKDKWRTMIKTGRAKYFKRELGGQLDLSSEED